MSGSQLLLCRTLEEAGMSMCLHVCACMFRDTVYKYMEMWRCRAQDDVLEGTSLAPCHYLPHTRLAGTETVHLCSHHGQGARAHTHTITCVDHVCILGITK